MKRILLGGAVVLVLGGLTWAVAAQFRSRSVSTGLATSSAPLMQVTAPPLVVGAPNLSPLAITQNTLTQVLATVYIPETTVLGVNLIRLNNVGTSTIIATLNDSGQNGDQVAGDHIFTARFNHTEANLGPIDFITSVAFRGSLRRALSRPTTINVISSGLRTLSANGLVLQYPADFLLSTASPNVDETYTLANRTPVSSGGLDAPSGCAITISTNTKSPGTSLNQWISSNSRTGGVDSDIVRNGLPGLRKAFVDEITNEPAVLYFFDGSDRVHALSTVGESCVSILDTVIQNISF